MLARKHDWCGAPIHCNWVGHTLFYEAAGVGTIYRLAAPHGLRERVYEFGMWSVSSVCATSRYLAVGTKDGHVAVFREDGFCKARWTMPKGEEVLKVVANRDSIIVQTFDRVTLYPDPCEPMRAEIKYRALRDHAERVVLYTDAGMVLITGGGMHRLTTLDRLGEGEPVPSGHIPQGDGSTVVVAPNLCSLVHAGVRHESPAPICFAQAYPGGRVAAMTFRDKRSRWLSRALLLNGGDPSPDLCFVATAIDGGYHGLPSTLPEHLVLHSLRADRQTRVLSLTLA